MEAPCIFWRSSLTMSGDLGLRMTRTDVVVFQDRRGFKTVR